MDSSFSECCATDRRDDDERGGPCSHRALESHCASDGSNGRDYRRALENLDTKLYETQLSFVAIGRLTTVPTASKTAPAFASLLRVTVPATS